jgi:thiaminase
MVGLFPPGCTSLAQANAMELAQAEAAFLRVATLEKAFWQMAYGEGVRV